MQGYVTMYFRSAAHLYLAQTTALNMVGRSQIGSHIKGLLCGCFNIITLWILGLHQSGFDE